MLGLATAERVEITTGAAIDGEADDLVGGDGAVEGGKEGVVKREEDVALEPDALVGIVGASAGAGLELDGGAGDGFEGERFGGGADVEDDAFGAAAKDGDGGEVDEVDLRRRRRRRVEHRRGFGIVEEIWEGFIWMVSW